MRWTSALDYGCFIYWSCLACLYTQRIWKRTCLGIHLLICFLHCLWVPVWVCCIHEATQFKKSYSLFCSKAATVWINSETFSHTLTFPQLLFSMQHITQYYSQPLHIKVNNWLLRYYVQQWPLCFGPVAACLLCYSRKVWRCCTEDHYVLSHVTMVP